MRSGVLRSTSTGGLFGPWRFDRFFTVHEPHGGLVFHLTQLGGGQVVLARFFQLVMLRKPLKIVVPIAFQHRGQPAVSGHATGVFIGNQVGNLHPREYRIAGQVAEIQTERASRLAEIIFAAERLLRRQFAGGHWMPGIERLHRPTFGRQLVDPFKEEVPANRQAEQNKKNAGEPIHEVSSKFDRVHVNVVGR